MVLLFQANNYSFDSDVENKKIDVFENEQYIASIYPLTHHYILDEEQLSDKLISSCKHYLRYKKAA